MGVWLLLDLSLVGLRKSAPQLEAVVGNMLEVYHRWQTDAEYLDGEHKSLQIGFCDLGTPNKDSDQVYGNSTSAYCWWHPPMPSAISMKQRVDRRQSFNSSSSADLDKLPSAWFDHMLGTGTNIQNDVLPFTH